MRWWKWIRQREWGPVKFAEWATEYLETVREGYGRYRVVVEFETKKKQGKAEKMGAVTVRIEELPKYRAMGPEGEER